MKFPSLSIVAAAALRAAAGKEIPMNNLRNSAPHARKEHDQKDPRGQFRDPMKLSKEVKLPALPPEPLKSSINDAKSIDDSRGGKKMGCCRPRLPKCCPLGTEMMWDVGTAGKYMIPGATAQQPATYNEDCLNSVDFDTVPSGTGQPFCHEIVMAASAAAMIQSAVLELIIYSSPPCNKVDRLCLTTATGNQWCDMLENGMNHLCLDLDELGLINDGGMSNLLVRVAHHSSVDYLRLHTVMCEPVVPSGVSSLSMHFDFTNNLTPTTLSVPDFTIVPSGTLSYFTGGPSGTAVVFPSSPNFMLQMPNHSSQQGGSKLSMAARIYYDEPGYPFLLGTHLVSKYGSYRWMVNPGAPWYYQHVHLGPGFGDIVEALPRSSDPNFVVPIKKWLCMAVTIDADSSSGTTTLSYYLNGELWGPPTVRNTVYDMDGTEDLVINDNTYGWKGKMDSFSLWQSVLTRGQINDYCNCHNVL